ncbi:MAG: EAL domain-containing protein [Kordiimonas sp.]
MIEHVYQTIVGKHDYQLLLIALALCLISSFTAVSLNERARASSEKQRDHWILLAAASLGVGVWATNFISVLAYDLKFDASYSLPVALAALVMPILIASLGFRVATYNRTKRARGAAGLIVGLGIVGVHFLTVFAIDFSGSIQQNLDYVVVAVAAGLGLSGAAHVGMNKTQDIVRYCVSAGLLTAAVCGTHFIAMAGVSFDLDSVASGSTSTVLEAYWVIGVSLVTLGFLGYCLSSAFVERTDAEGKTLEAVRLKSLADAALEGIVVMDAGGHVVNVNESFSNLSGRRLSELRGHHLQRYFADFEGNDNICSLTEGLAHLPEVGLHNLSGTPIPTELFFKQANVNGEIQHIAVVRDLREKKEAEQQISYLSNYDMLTGLANRQLMMDGLRHAVPFAARNKSIVAIFYIDVDGFKELNSVAGQQGGDALLTILATRLKACAGDADTVARIGADQFCIIQEKIEQAEEAGNLAELICKRVSEPFSVGSSIASVSVSIGIAAAPNDAEMPSDLLACAEIAMKNAKASAGNSYNFYEEALDKAQFQRRQLKTDLVGAIERGEITMAYQPQFGARESEAIGFEALVRWQHPKRGAIGPAEFIPLAEESGHVIELGQWIIEEACSEAASWTKPLTIAVNLSPVQFQQAELPEIVAAALKESGLAPERLEIEITEGVLINDVDHALQVLGRLKASGAKLAMDDFGTGYSSLSYLRRFPFDKLKIDKSFIRNLHDSEQSRCIVRGMIGLAHGLKVPILAEGVETEEQFAMLRVEGCDEIQGYFLGKPKPISEYTNLTGADQEAEAASNVHVLR